MKNTLILCIMLLLSISALCAQDIWVQMYHPFISAHNYGNNILVCQDGGYVINGSYEEPCGYYLPQYYCFMMKTDENGNLLWVNCDSINSQRGYNIHVMVQTSDNGILAYVSGRWGYEALIKRNAEGVILWSMDQPDIYLYNMIRTPDNHVLLVGKTRMDNMAMMRLISEEGETLWTKVYQLEDTPNLGLESVCNSSDGGLS